MKTTTLLLATVFTLHISMLFAGNNETDANNSVRLNNPVTAIDISFTTPLEATFEEVIDFNAFNISGLSPELPAEADFLDMVSDNAANFYLLAPVTPNEADFEDFQEIQLPDLTPSIPMEADFEVF